MRALLMSFNEAEASLPRNTIVHLVTKDTIDEASMRPRQACLGIRCSTGVRRAWGRRCFNEAEASLPRNTLNGAASRSSRRRGFNEAEASLPRNTSAYGNSRQGSRSASMRPRQACLGIQCPLGQIRPRLRRASMRPRQACLGIPHGTTGTPGPHVHRFNEAEASLPRNTCCPRRA